MLSVSERVARYLAAILAAISGCQRPRFGRKQMGRGTHNDADENSGV